MRGRGQREKKIAKRRNKMVIGQGREARGGKRGKRDGAREGGGGNGLGNIGR